MFSYSINNIVELIHIFWLVLILLVHCFDVMMVNLPARKSVI